MQSQIGTDHLERIGILAQTTMDGLIMISVASDPAHNLTAA